MRAINENLKLGIFDTVHDFWKERKISQNDEEDEDNQPLGKKQDFIREKLLKFISLYLDISPPLTINTNNSINTFLKSLSNNKITSSTNNYERMVNKYYEENSNLKDLLKSETTQTLRYGDIIDSYVKANGNQRKNILLQKYIRSNGTNYVLELSCGDHKKYSSFGIIQKNPKNIGYIANFILNYYYPGITSSVYNAYFTFDSNTGIIGKIFRDIKEVFQLVTPSNISDSAITTFKCLNNRNEFFFPEKEWIFTSNYYTNDKIQLKFIKSPKGFSLTNQFGFSLFLKTNNQITVKFDFSNSQKEGPSVNYLIDLMNIGETAIPNKNSIINISKLAEKRFKPFIDNGLLFDIKRSGDYEQVNFAHYSRTKNKLTIFSTIDILCSLYARSIQQNTVWHNKEKMILYRFPSTNIDPAILKINNIKQEAIVLLQELQILKKILNQENGINYDIINFMLNATTFYNKGVYFDNLRKKGTPKMVSESIITILIKIRLLDIMFFLSNLSNLIMRTFSETIINQESQQILNNIDDNINSLNQFVLIENPELVTEDIYNNIKLLLKLYKELPTVSNIINILKKSLNLTPNQVKLLYTRENGFGLNYDFFKQDIFKNISFIKFNYTGINKEFNFSNIFYSNLYNVFNKFERIHNNVRGSSNLYNKLHKMDYFTLTNDLYQSYLNSNISEDVYNILQPQNSSQNEEDINSDIVCDYWWNNIESSLLSILAKYQSELTSNYSNIKLDSLPIYELTINSGGSKENIQKGGIADILQIYNLSDLLRLISGKSAQFIESFITEYVPNGQTDLNLEDSTTINNLIVELYNHPNICKETINNILFMFSDGLMNIQNESDQGYDYYPTPTEFELLFCLSFMYSPPEGNIVNDFYININNNFYNKYIQALNGLSSNTNNTSITTINSLSTTGRGSGINITRLNDIYNIYNTSIITDSNGETKIIPAEILNLLVLTLIDNTMQNINNIPNPKIGFFYNFINKKSIPSAGFDNILSWSRLMDYFYVYLYLFSRNNSENGTFTASLGKIKQIFGGKKKTIKRKFNTKKNTKKNKLY